MPLDPPNDAGRSGDPTPNELLQRARDFEESMFAHAMSPRGIIPSLATTGAQPAHTPAAHSPGPTPPATTPPAGVQPVGKPSRNRPRNVAATVCKLAVLAFVIAFAIALFTIQTPAKPVADFCIMALVLLLPVILVSGLIGIIHWFIHR